MNNDHVIQDARDLLEQGKASEAVQLLRGAVDTQDPEVEATYLLGVALFRTKDYVQSEQMFRNVISRVPENHLSVYYLGLSLERQGKREAAVRAYRTAVKLEPGFGDGHRKLAQMGEATTPPQATPKTVPARSMTEFSLPDTDEELDAYIERKRQKERASFTLRWRATPLWAKIIQSIILVAVFGTIAIIFTFLAFQALREFG